MKRSPIRNVREQYRQIIRIATFAGMTLKVHILFETLTRWNVLPKACQNRKARLLAELKNVQRLREAINAINPKLLSVAFTDGLKRVLAVQTTTY